MTADRNAPARVAHRSTVVLDNRRVPCATGLIRARRRMAELAAGDVLEVHSHDRFAPFELPVWAERDGHEVLSVHRDGRWPRRTFRIAIRKRPREGTMPAAGCLAGEPT